MVAEYHGLVVPLRQPGAVIEEGEVALDLVDLDTLTCLQRVAPPQRMVLRSVGCTWGTGQLGYNVVRAGEVIASFSGIARELAAAPSSPRGGL